MDGKKFVGLMLIIVAFVLIGTGIGATLGVPLLAYTVFAYGRNLFLNDKKWIGGERYESILYYRKNIGTSYRWRNR